MLVDRARQIRLLGEPEHVLERDQRERRRRLRREGNRGVDRRRGLRRRRARFGRRRRAFESTPQRLAILRALSVQAASSPDRARACAMSAPLHQPATVGRSCVRGHRDGIAPPFAGGRNGFAIALEPEHVHAGDAGARDALAEFGLHRAEILADHDGAMWRCDSSAISRSRSSSG
jgi:hypothetical protein